MLACGLAVTLQRRQEIKIMEMEKTYNPAAIDEMIYDRWLQKKYFHAEVDRSKKPFTIVMPPPNVTGQLHMGHALDNTMQDILIRYKRMQGYNALWQPGTDHASIATEVKIIQKLKEQGLRITKQRLILLDIVLEEDCSCCKEIYYKASQKDDKIGSATVYRMINTLEEIGAISRKNMYKVACEELCENGSCEAEKKKAANSCIVELSDRTTYCLSAEKLDAVFQAGLKACGYIEDQEIKKIAWNSDMCCAR